MFEHWDYILAQIISTCGSFASITAFQAMQDDKNRVYGEQVKNEVKNEVGKEATSRLKNGVNQSVVAVAPKDKPRKTSFFHRFKYLIIISAISIGLIITVEIVLELIEKNASSITTAAVPAVVETKLPITSWPIKRSAKDRWLDEMEAKVSHNDVFFVKQWDTFDFVEIKNKAYPHSIGARIPLEAQEKYRNSNSSRQVEHTEYIEYPLGFEYATLHFDFGIDDLSSPFGANKSYCLYKIIVDECNSESFYSPDQDHLFETDWLDDMCCPRRTPQMDVSGFESVRITIMWQFNPMNNGPNALNIAIFNPILRAAKIHM